MRLRFSPKFVITPEIAADLVRIEAAREAMSHLPITPGVLASLRESARLFSTHYSTQIEGNRLTEEEVSRVLGKGQHIAGRERDEREVLGYYAALEEAERLSREGGPTREEHIQALHGLTMGGGKGRVKPSAYRDGQNVIRDSVTGKIVYMPPEAKDVPVLMRQLVEWLEFTGRGDFPCALRAAVAHYQFATIHPYYDGNGRTARLLTTLVLHSGGYGLKGLYSLEEYYARDLHGYYEALSVGPSHNYYMGRAKSDISHWIAYFCRGAAESFENVKRRAEEAWRRGAQDQSAGLRSLDPRQRKGLELFRKSDAITSRDVEQLFGFSQRTARALLGKWVVSGFVVVIDPAKKSRRYGLGPSLRHLVV